MISLRGTGAHPHRANASIMLSEMQMLSVFCPLRSPSQLWSLSADGVLSVLFVSCTISRFWFFTDLRAVTTFTVDIFFD